MKGPLRIFTGAAGLLALLAFLILLNAVATTLRLRADTTAEKLYTLSEGSRAVLRDLPREVTLKFYASQGQENIAPALKQYAQRIGDLLREYAGASGGRVTLEILDPQPDSDEEEWAQRYGVLDNPMDPLGGASFYLGLVALSGAKQAAIPFFSPADEPQLEYLVTRLLNEVTRTRKPKIGVISSLPILGMQPSYMGMGMGTPPWVVISELRNQYQVEQLPPAFTEIPAEMDAVLVVHPKGLGEPALFALDQFVLRGGRLVAFVDPLCLTEQDYQRGAAAMLDKASDLNRLTQAWGLTMDTFRVVADPGAATRVRLQDGRTQEHPAWLSLRAHHLNREEITTAPLENLMLPMAGFFTGAPAEGLVLTPLIHTANGAGSITAIEAGMGAMAGTSSFEPRAESAPIALRLAGRFKTAFPDGRPKDPDLPVEQPGETTTPGHLTESTTNGIVVLVADVDVIADDYASQRINAFGRSAVQLVNDNINFAANVLGQLVGGDQLISLRSRGSFDRPFHRVLALEGQAQERWRQEELKLQEQLRLTNMKLAELESAKDPGQQYVVTPAQRQEIEQFREQAAQTRRQLKEVRKSLRQEIESLGLLLKGLNMAAVPAVVILFGLAHGCRRRRM